MTSASSTSDSTPGSGLIAATQDAAARALKAAGVAAVAAGYGLVALIAGSAAALLAGMAIVGRVAGAGLAHLSQTVREAIPAAVAAAPGIMHVLALAAALAAALWSGLRLHQAYGGDWLAAVPASLLAITPLLTFYVEDPTAGRAAVAAGLAVLAGWVVGFIPLWLLGCLTAAIYAWLITHTGFSPPAKNRGLLPEAKCPRPPPETDYPGLSPEANCPGSLPASTPAGAWPLARPPIQDHTKENHETQLSDRGDRGAVDFL